jgi:ribosomal protein S18 acetylase RimI-like enzyme
MRTYESVGGASRDENRPALSLSIRSIASPDLPKVAEMLAQSFHGDCNRLLYGLLRLSIYEDLRQRVTFPKSRQICWVAIERGPDRPSWPQLEAIAGTVEIDVRQRFPWPFALPNYVYLSNLAVANQERRRGVASQLLRHCETTAKGWGFGAVYLHVMEDNAGARRLYGRAGYRVCGTEPSIGHLLFGQPRRLMLQKIL